MSASQPDPGIDPSTVPRACRVDRRRRGWVGARRAGSAGAILRRRQATGGVKRRDPSKSSVAAQIAEALAVTTYTNIINTAPFFTRLASDDQGYLKTARNEGDVSLPASRKA